MRYGSKLNEYTEHATEYSTATVFNTVNLELNIADQFKYHDLEAKGHFICGASRQVLC